MTTAPEGFVPPPAPARPIHVVYVGNFRHPWCTEVHVAASLRAEGHTVSEAQEDRTAWATVERLVEQHRADLVLWTRTWPAEMAEVVPVLDRLRDRGVPTVSYHLDRWFGLDREHQVQDQPFFRSALVVSPDDSPRWADEGVNHLWLPPGVFDQECHPVRPDPQAWPAPVVFVGSHPYPHQEWAGYRSELIARMTEAFPTEFAVLPRKGKPIRGKALQTLYATAKVVVGDSCLAGESYRYWSDRVPETLGRGAFLIHPSVAGDIGQHGAWYRSGHDLSTYTLGDFDRVVDLTRHALNPVNADLVQRVRDQGRATVLARDTYRHRLSTVIDHVGTTLGFPVWPEPAAAPAPPPPRLQPLRVVSSGGARYRAAFELRPELAEVDRSVIEEVWSADDYRVCRRRFRGNVLDVGGNIGAFSVLAAKAGGKVTAFEPHPGNRARLEHHAAINRVAVDVHPFAIVGADGPDTVTIEGDGGGAHVGDGTGHKAATRYLGAILRDLGQVEFMKIDVEGAEYGIFADLPAHVLHDHVAELAMEFHGPGMPHLAHLDADGDYLDRWKHMVAVLADCGRVEIMGHPTVGGLIWWRRY